MPILPNSEKRPHPRILSEGHPRRDTLELINPKTLWNFSVCLRRFALQTVLQNCHTVLKSWFVGTKSITSHFIQRKWERIFPQKRTAYVMIFNIVNIEKYIHPHDSTSNCNLLWIETLQKKNINFQLTYRLFICWLFDNVTTLGQKLTLDHDLKLIPTYDLSIFP